jgi:hypothetical protein
MPRVIEWDPSSLRFPRSDNVSPTYRDQGSHSQIVEDPKSGREKQVLLTAKGERFLLTMVERGRAFFRPVGERLTPNLIRDGLVFLRLASAALEDAKSSAGEITARRQ